MYTKKTTENEKENCNCNLFQIEKQAKYSTDPV